MGLELEAHNYLVQVAAGPGFGGPPSVDRIVDRAAAFLGVVADILFVKDVVVGDYHFAFEEPPIGLTLAFGQASGLWSSLY